VSGSERVRTKATIEYFLVSGTISIRSRQMIVNYYYDTSLISDVLDTAEIQLVESEKNIGNVRVTF